MPATTTGVATSFIDFTRASNATVTDSDGKVKWAPHNLLTNSESFNAASWTKSSVTPTANSIAAPNGTTTADTLAASGANGTTLQTFTAEAISYTFGVWLKRKTGTGNIQIAADSGTYTTVTITSDWALYTVTQTPTAGSKTAGIRIVTSADEVYAWGASLYRSDLAMQPNTSAYPLYNPTTPKNLLGYTEDFANAYWTKSSTAALATSVANPNGLSSSVLVYPSSTGSDRLVYRTPSITGVASTTYTISVYAKAAGINFLYFGTLGGGTSPSSSLAYFDLQNGVRTQVGSAFTSATITPVGSSGWYRCSAVATASLATLFPVFGLADANNSAAVTASGTSGIYLWGAQLSDSASLDPYVPVYGAAVTSAAYYGPRRDFDGATLACKGLLVEEQRTNLTTYSSEFDNAAWGKANLNTTGTPAWVNVQTAPDGNLSADKLIESNTTAQHYVSRAQTVTSGSTYTLSFYLRAGERTWAWLEFYGGIPTGTGYINLSTGDKGTTTGSASAVTVTNVGGNWWRVVLPGFVASSTTPAFAVYTSTGNGVNSYAGDGSSGIYIWGAQLEENASFATSYIPVGSTTAGATRNADVASVSTQAFPYSATEGTLVVSGSPVINQNISAYFVQLASDVAGTNYGSSNAIFKGATSGLGVGQKVKGMTVTDANSFVSEVATTGDINTDVIKASYAFAANNFGLSVNGSAVIPDTSGAMPSASTVLMIGAMRGGIAGYFMSGHIRQITYLPRRISNADLVTRST